MAGKAIEKIVKRRGPKPGPGPLVNATARIYLRHDEHDAADTFSYIISTYGSIKNYIRQHDPRCVGSEKMPKIDNDSEEIEADDIDWSAMGI